jgi:hypothetical protein
LWVWAQKRRAAAPSCGSRLGCIFHPGSETAAIFCLQQVLGARKSQIDSIIKYRTNFASTWVTAGSVRGTFAGVDQHAGERSEAPHRPV